MIGGGVAEVEGHGGRALRLDCGGCLLVALWWGRERQQVASPWGGVGVQGSRVGLRRWVCGGGGARGARAPFPRLASRRSLSLLSNQLQRYCYFIAEQSAPEPHLAHPEIYAALRIVLVTVPRGSRICEHFPDGFDLQLLVNHI